MRTITREQAERTKHLRWCPGYEDCDCFSSLWSHKEIYEMQSEIERLRAEVEKLERQVGKPLGA